MADEPQTASTPKAVQMPRTVHELLTGPKPEQKLAPGTLLTDDVAKLHKLDGKTVDALKTSGAIEMVEVLKD